MSGEPFPNLPDAEFPFADGFCDELVRREGFDFQIMAVDAEKGVRRRETDSFVAVEKGMVVGERLHQRGGFVNQVVVVSALRTKDGSFQEPPVSKPMNSAKLLDELPVHLHGLADGHVDVPRHLLRQEFVQLPILVSRATEIAHYLRPHRPLRRHHELEVVLQRFFQQKPSGLPVFLGQFG